MRHSKRNNNSLKIGLSLFASLILLFIGFWLNIFIVKPDYSFLIFAILKTVCLSLSIVSLLLLSFFIYKSTSNKTINNLSISFVSILSFFLIFEIIFSFYTPSTNVFTDLSNQIWIKRYAQQKNSLGYRDEEPVSQSGKKNILVIGDSFVAGHGVTYDEMFVNIMKEDLKDTDNLFNLGVNGSHTDREFDSLINYPIKPDIIILCYYHNDIESAMKNFNILPKIENPKENLSNFSKFFIDNSLLLNFIFTINAKKSISRQYMESEQNDLTAYLRKDLWQYQANSIDKFYNYAIEKESKLLILFLPAVGDGIVLTNELAGKKVEQYCNERDIEFINIYSDIKNIPLERRVANSLDHHPSAEVNKIIASLLEKRINQL